MKHLKHCETSWNSHHLMRRYRRSMCRCLRLGQRHRQSCGGYSMRWYRRLMLRHRRSCGVSGDCGVGITSQMCNRVTNHGDMSTFSKPVSSHRRLFPVTSWYNYIIIATFEGLKQQQGLKQPLLVSGAGRAAPVQCFQNCFKLLLHQVSIQPVTQWWLFVW